MFIFVPIASEIEVVKMKDELDNLAKLYNLTINLFSMKEFTDINLKFALISCLNELGLYFEEADNIKMNAMDTKKFQKLDYDDIVPQVYDYYKSLEITAEDIEKIIEFNPSASNECYNLLVKEWSGEDDIFDIVSLNGIEQLPNLEVFNPFGLLDWDVDINALLHCKKLKIVYTEFIPTTKETESVLSELSRNGVEIK